MIQQDDLDGRVFTYNGMGLLWVKGEWIGTDQNDKSKPLPNTWAVSLKPLPVDCSGETNPLNVQISKLNDKVDQLKTQNTTLVGHNTEFGKELETLHTLLEDSQVQIDDLKTQIENMTPEDQIVDSEPSGGLWQIIKNWFNKWKGNK